MPSDKEFIQSYVANICYLNFDVDNPVFGKAPGTRYDKQYYMARSLYNVDFVEAVCREFEKIIDEKIGHWNFQLAGCDWSSIPLLTSLPLHIKKSKNIHLNSFYVRPERKNYGLNNYVEGITNNLPVLIVNDICNSTNKFKFCHDVVKNTENLDTLPYLFAVLNKLATPESKIEDVYLKDHKPLYIIDGADVHAARYTI